MTTDNRLADLPYNGSLEEFLSALYYVVHKYRDECLSGALLSRILKEAWSMSAPPVIQERKLTERPTKESFDDGFNYLQHMLLYQIQDLQLMRESGILDHTKYAVGPLISPSNDRWYNWSPSHFVDVLETYPDSLGSDYTWEEIADYLWDAQIYE